MIKRPVRMTCHADTANLFQVDVFAFADVQGAVYGIVYRTSARVWLEFNVLADLVN